MTETSRAAKFWSPSVLEDDLVLLTEPDLTEANLVVAHLNSHSETIPQPWDMHYALELGLVCEGRMKRVYRDWETTLGPGQFWLCGTCEPHGWEVRESPCNVTVLLVQPSALLHDHLLLS